MNEITRREFLQGAAVGAAALAIPLTIPSPVEAAEAHVEELPSMEPSTAIEAGITEEAIPIGRDGIVRVPNHYYPDSYSTYRVFNDSVFDLPVNFPVAFASIKGRFCVVSDWRMVKIEYAHRVHRERLRQ